MLYLWAILSAKHKFFSHFCWWLWPELDRWIYFPYSSNVTAQQYITDVYQSLLTNWSSAFPTHNPFPQVHLFPVPTTAFLVDIHDHELVALPSEGLTASQATSLSCKLFYKPYFSWTVPPCSSRPCNPFLWPCCCELSPLQFIPKAHPAPMPLPIYCPAVPRALWSPWGRNCILGLSLSII